MKRPLSFSASALAVIFTFLALAGTAQTITIGTQTGAGSTNALLSTSTTGNLYSKTISIYTASAINAAGGYPGMITKLRWNKQGTGEYTFGDATLVVHLKHVTNATWPGTPTNWTTEVAGATQVFSTNTWSMPTGTGWVEIALSTPFMWNGTDNLAVFVDFYRPSTPTAAINWAYDITGNTGTNATQVGSSATTSLGILNANRPLLQMELLGSTPIDAGVSSIPVPAPSATPGSFDISAAVTNYGTNALNSVNVAWEVNGSLQTPVPLNFTPGLSQGANSGSLPLGTVNLINGVNTIRAWTESPNGVPDGLNANDTSVQTITLADGNYTVGATGTFLNLTQVTSFLNTAKLTGDVTFTLLNDYDGTSETFPLSFTPFSTIGGNRNVTIRPAAGVTARLTAGNPASNTPLIILDGVDNLCFDGRPVGGATSEWTIRNMRTASTFSPAFRFMNDATFDTLRFLQIESGNTATTTTAAGTIQFFTSTGTMGNSYNAISDCIIRDRSDVSGIHANAIYSNGTASAPNSYNTITDNQIFNFSANGVNVTATGNGDGWRINNNHFYNTLTATSAQTSINFLSAASDNQINNNFIGGNTTGAGGTPWTSSGANLFAGIIANVGTGITSTIQGNTISNVSRTSTGAATFTGIRNTGGAVTISGNTIGSASTANSIISTGTGLMAGIESKNTTAASVISNNVVANITSNGATGNGIVRGIAYDPGTPFAIDISGNDIHHLSTNGVATGFAGGSITISGIYAFPTGYSPASLIRNNIIHDIVAGNTGTAVTIAAGLMLTNFAGEIYGNTIYNIQNASTAPSATPSYAAGIYSRFMDPGYVYNNMISLGAGLANNVQVNGVMITGGDPSPGGTQHFYHNSIVLSNNNSASSNVFKRGEAATLTTTHPVRLLNNILYNNITAPGQHLVFHNGISAPASNWQVSDTNLIFAPGADIGLWGANLYALPNWTSTSLQDAGSKIKSPSFSNMAVADLHLTGSSIGDPDFSGTPIPGLTTDFDGDIRTNVPYIGADENVVSPLPITFLSTLKARVEEIQHTQLTWRSGTGKGLLHYEVEVSRNGREFQPLGTVAAKPDALNGNSYEYRHLNARSWAGKEAVAYYRLKNVYLNGKSEYSSIVMVRFTGNAVRQISVYPNPVVDQLTVEIYSPQAAPYHYVLTDVSGRVVLKGSGVAEGQALVTENGVRNLSAGNYLLRVVVDGLAEQYKITKQ